MIPSIVIFLIMKALIKKVMVIVISIVLFIKIIDNIMSRFKIVLQLGEFFFTAGWVFSFHEVSFIFAGVNFIFAGVKFIFAGVILSLQGSAHLGKWKWFIQQLFSSSSPSFGFLSERSSKTWSVCRHMILFIYYDVVAWGAFLVLLFQLMVSETDTSADHWQQQG